jgi:hypothetical protein
LEEAGGFEGASAVQGDVTLVVSASVGDLACAAGYEDRKLLLPYL